MARSFKPKADYVPQDHYKVLTDKIVASLEEGKVPWRRPWDKAKAGTGGPQAPMNAATGKRYSGINTLILGMDPRAFMTLDPRWATFNQAKDKGWSVRKGEKATTVFFYKKLLVTDDRKAGDGGPKGGDGDGDGMRSIPLLKSFSVFHASQIDGIPEYAPLKAEAAPWLRPEAASIILKESGAVVRTGGDKAFYSPGTDHIQMPPDRAFETPEGWAATALHELGHWTGHEDRLARDLTKRFGSAGYAQEELRAELASCFISAELGIPSEIPHHASYIASWLHTLKDDKREIFRAASDAQKMADMCLGFHPEYRASRDAEAKDEAVHDEEAAPALQAVEAAPRAAPVAALAVERSAISAPSFAPAARPSPAPEPAYDFAGALNPESEPSRGPRR